MNSTWRPRIHTGGGPETGLQGSEGPSLGGRVSEQVFCSGVAGLWPAAPRLCTGRGLLVAWGGRGTQEKSSLLLKCAQPAYKGRAPEAGLAVQNQSLPPALIKAICCSGVRCWFSRRLGLAVQMLPLTLSALSCPALALLLLACLWTPCCARGLELLGRGPSQAASFARLLSAQKLSPAGAQEHGDYPSQAGLHCLMCLNGPAGHQEMLRAPGPACATSVMCLVSPAATTLPPSLDRSSAGQQQGQSTACSALPTHDSSQRNSSIQMV